MLLLFQWHCCPCIAEDNSLVGQVKILSSSHTITSTPSIVWLEAIDAPMFITRDEPKIFSIVTRNKKFRPQQLLIKVGDVVKFPNNDFFKHSVFSLSGKNTFDLGYNEPGEEPRQRFKEPGVVRVYCNIHSTMSSIIVVSNSGVGTLTQKDGSFTIRDLPEGSYTLHVFNVRGENSIDITVPQRAPISIEIDDRNFEQQPHLNKEGKKYSEPEEDEYF